MPVRFTSPGLGGLRESSLQGHRWQIGFAFRRLTADQWFVGTRVDETAAPFGQPLYLDINSLDISLTRGLTPRLSLTLTVPIQYGTHARTYADGARHRVESYGVGDVTLVGNLWLRDPRSEAGSNLMLGLGLKPPTGSNEVLDEWFNADGSVVQRPVDQSIQLSDGGWGIILQAQAFQRLSERLGGYFVGSYLVSPKETTEVPSPIPSVPLAVPDVYGLRAGLGYAVPFAPGVSLSLGGRFDGIPVRDLIGGGDDGFRRPGYTLYLDPGVTIRRGAQEVFVSVPARLHQNFQLSLIDRKLGHRGGGDLADYLIFVSYTRSF